MNQPQPLREVHENLRIVMNLPNILDKLEPQSIKLEKWQKDEVVREIFDCMELNLNSFAKSLAAGVSIGHLYTTEPTMAQAYEINKLYLEVGMEIYFRCLDMGLFKQVVSEDSVGGFIDTFPLYLEVVGADYVILTHNDLVRHPVARSVNIV